MTFDIISVTEAEYNAYSLIQKKLLRTAQKEKDKLQHQLKVDQQTAYQIAATNNVLNSTIYTQKVNALKEEFDRQVAILREQLQFNLSVCEPTNGSELGGGGADQQDGYLVDYSLSYLERYNIVRDYYMSIPEPNERLALFNADEVAKRYLSSYYVTLYNYLLSFTTGE